MYQRLSIGVESQEGVQKKLEEDFLEGKSNAATAGSGDAIATEREVVEFVKKFREAVKVAYLRRERKARWDEGKVGGWR